MLINATLPFGPLLKHMRKQAGMTQGDLAAALGYSGSLICSLEKAKRQPNLKAVIERFVPALGLQDDPQAAAALIEQAALARGERPPASVTFQHTTRLSAQEESSARGTHLPSPPTELVGRDALVHQLCNRLLGHSGRLLTLVGPPGIGKTTLALAVAARLQGHYRDGVVFVPLAEVTDPTLMAATILTAVGSTDLSRPQTWLIEFLRHKTMLLVLDNCEQIIGAAPLVAELVAECSGLCVLATSRERLHLRAEQRCNVPPLDLADAVDLFTQRVQAIASDFSRTPGNQPTLEAICQRLDCLPLALELCAAEIELLSPTQLLAQLQAQSLDLLVDGAHDLPLRQRTLRTAIGTSYALLSEDERSLFRSLSIFMGGCDWHGVAAIATGRVETSAQPLHFTLHALVSKSLVRAESLPNGEQRFSLLETIREYALEQARAHGEEALLRERHYAFYLQLFRTADSQLRGPEAATWLAQLEAEQDNVRAALLWTLDEARYADMAWLLVVVHWFWHLHGNWYECGAWLARLLPHRFALTPDLRLAILLNLFSVARAVEEFQPVDRWTGEVMQLLDLCSDKLLHAAAWHFSAAFSADFHQSATASERSIALARAASEAPGLGPEFGLVTDRDFVLGNAIWAYAERLVEYGEFAQAIPLLKESLEIFRARESRYEMADGLGTLGRLSLLQGKLAQAHKLLCEAITISTAYNYQEMLGYLQPFIGLVTLYLGDSSEARRLLDESLRLCAELRDKGFLARVCTFLAETALWEEDVAQAAQWLARSLGYDADPQLLTIYGVQRLWVAARLATAQQQHLRAATLFGLADQVHSQVHDAIGGRIRSLADAALATVRAELEPAVFAEAFAAGRQMSLNEPFALSFISLLRAAELSR